MLNSLFGQSRVPSAWKELISIKELEMANEASADRPVVLFKHSTRCGISAYAKERLAQLAIDDTFIFFYLDLIKYRGISDEIASRYKVIHQSPQIIILKNGKASFTTSHHAINSDVITKNLF